MPPSNVKPVGAWVSGVVPWRRRSPPPPPAHPPSCSSAGSRVMLRSSGQKRAEVESSVRSCQHPQELLKMQHAHPPLTSQDTSYRFQEHTRGHTCMHMHKCTHSFKSAGSSCAKSEMMIRNNLWSAFGIYLTFIEGVSSARTFFFFVSTEHVALF